jgi:hypothetical protein
MESYERGVRGGFLWTRQWSFGSHKWQKVPWPDEPLLSIVKRCGRAHRNGGEKGIFRHLPFPRKYSESSVHMSMIKKKKKLRGLSPQANYTDRTTAAVGEVVPTFAGRGVLRGQRNGFPRPLISVF